MKLRNLPDDEKQRLKAASGLEGLGKVQIQLVEKLRLCKSVARHASQMEPMKIAAEFETENPYNFLTDRPAEWDDPTEPKTFDAMTPGNLALFKDKMLRSTGQHIEHVSRELLKNQDLLSSLGQQSEEFSLQGLCRLWAKVRDPRHKRNFEATTGQLEKSIGRKDYRNVTRDDITKFRDDLERVSPALSRETQRTYLNQVKAMFSVAMNEAKISTNPALEVRVLGKQKNGESNDDRPFTGADLKTIFKKAGEYRFGGERHEEAMWILRLLA